MTSLATELSRERVKFLISSAWPTLASEVDDWLRHAPEGRLADPPAGSFITPVTANIHEGQVAGFSWFASYADPAELVEAHDKLGVLITALLGVPGIQDREPDYSGYWATAQFAVETYAHDALERQRPGRLEPTLQVNVADAALAASQESAARGLHPR